MTRREEDIDASEPLASADGESLWSPKPRPCLSAVRLAGQRKVAGSQLQITLRRLFLSIASNNQQYHLAPQGCFDWRLLCFDAN